ncbi:RagB/SusD family nutrient uptake outer membrane protein [Mariniphaga sediminis]|nr:RagB/SusD family nutrient uptake outer membrane protein [Mariniphaga sediminis]
MKNIISILFLVSASYYFTSCDDYLEMPAQTSFNQDSVFVNYRNAETYLYSLYERVPSIVLGWTDILNGPSRVSLTDEAGSLALQSSYRSHKVYGGNVDATWFTTSLGEDYYSRHWTSIRRNFIMIENIDNVSDITTTEKERIKAECKILIALEYFELFKRYGGVPLVKESLTADYPILDRESIENVVNYIVELCDEAIASPNLPAKVTRSIEFGRATKALAYGLKARTLLYAASPLFNTATPYMSLGENNKSICYTNYDKNRWKLAMDAASEAINFCESNGYAIVTDYGIDRNYVVACCKRPKDGNTEIMFGTMNSNSSATVRYTWSFRGRQRGAACNSPTHNAVEFYQNRDGSKVNWDQVIRTSAGNPDEPYENLDPRFDQTIAYNGSVWRTNPTMIVEFFDAGEDGVTDGKEGKKTAKTEYYYGTRKYLNGYEETSSGFLPMSPVMRLAEMYFIYAEASNEYQGPNATAFDLLDAIRLRSGMPEVNRSFSQEELRDFIVNERAVEFYAEDHRYFDVKRWLVQNPFVNIYNVKVLKWADDTYTYEKYLHQERAWYDHWYLHPFPQAEINKNYGLIQNPGW